VRTALPLQTRTPALSREKASPPVDSRSFGTRGSSERPPSIRDAIIRWLNEEL
jgi:hypothetical protein